MTKTKTLPNACGYVRGLLDDSRVRAEIRKATRAYIERQRKTADEYKNIFNCAKREYYRTLTWICKFAVNVYDAIKLIIPLLDGILFPKEYEYFKENPMSYILSNPTPDCKRVKRYRFPYKRFEEAMKRLSMYD